MSKRKGVQVPRNGFLETISSRFSEKQSCFVLGSASSGSRHHIVYCSDGFCELTGYPRSQVMQRNCSCSFLYGKHTDEAKRNEIEESLRDEEEYHTEIDLYKRDGSRFRCLLDIITTPRKQNDLIFLVSLKEIESDAKQKTGEMTIRSRWTEIEPPTGEETEETPFKSMQRRRSRALLHNGFLNNRNDATSNRLSDRRVLACRIDYSAKKSKYVIQHYGYFRTVWDWIMLFFSLYVLVFVPYYASLQARRISQFGLQNSTRDSFRHFTFWFDVGLEFIFILDIGLNFRTTFVNKRGQLESYSKKIASHYLRSAFILDFVCSLPFDFASLIFDAASISENVPFDLLKIVRAARMYKFYKKITNLSHYRPFVLLYLMIMFGLIAHWIACGWFVIGWVELHTTRAGEADGPGWLFELAESMQTPFYTNKSGGPETDSVYIASLYFTLSSLTSVGFGNVSANTDTEKIFSVIIMLIGAIMHAYVFGNITAIIQRIYGTRSELARREGNLKEFLKKNRFKKPLYRKLTGYFQTSWSLNKGVDEKEVISEFPKDLQADIAMHLHSDLLELPVFSGACQGCKRFASLNASRRMVAPEELLIHVGDPLEHAFLVCSGSLEATHKNKLYAFLGKGDFFGGDVSNDNILISKMQVQALTFCEIQCISIQSLKQIAMLYPSQCDIAREIGDDYSCKLWEKLDLDQEEFQQQRYTKIQNWNEHYDESNGNDCKSTSSNNDSICADVSIPVEPDSEQDQENNIEYDSEGGSTQFLEARYSEKFGRKQTLLVPSLDVTGVNSMSPSSSPTSHCTSPCLRSSEKRSCVKKRVSFDDGAGQNKRKGYRNDTTSLEPSSNNASSANQADCDDFSSRPVLNMSYRSLPLRNKNLHLNFKNISEEYVPNQEMKGQNSENIQFPPTWKPDEQLIRGKRSSSPGTSGESRRRRRRRKPAHKKERTSESSSTDEGDNRIDYKRERKMSVVDIYRDPVKSQVYHRHSSPEGRSSECGCQLAVVEKRLQDLESLVLAMSRNIEVILDKKNACGEGVAEAEIDGCVNRCMDSGSVEPFSKGSCAGNLLYCTDKQECNSSNDQLNHYHTSKFKSHPSIMNNRTEHMVTKFPDELKHLRRPNSAPSFYSTSSSFATDNEMLKTLSKPCARFNIKTDLTELQSTPCPARYSPMEMCDDGAFNEIQPTVLINIGNIENGSTKFTDQGIPSMFCFTSDGGAAADNQNDFEKSLLQNSHDNESSNISLPIISICDYDQYVMRESMTRSSPPQHRTIRESQSYLQIPRKRHMGGGSESGYSSSPTPDISCV